MAADSACALPPRQTPTGFVSDSGTFTITAVTTAAVEGRYALHFQNAPTQTGTFRVDRCGQDGGIITRCG